MCVHVRAYAEPLASLCVVGGDVGGHGKQRSGLERTDLVHRAVPSSGSANQSSNPR